MAYLSAIIGVGIVSALILYFSFKLDEDHFILKLLGIIAAFVLLAIVPSLSNQSLNNDCQWYVNDTWHNSTHENYNYVELCSTSSGNSTVAFMNVYYGFLILLFLYISVYIVIKALGHINETAIERKQRK